MFKVNKPFEWGDVDGLIIGEPEVREGCEVTEWINIADLVPAQVEVCEVSEAS